jgi:hypothetical protein
MKLVGLLAALSVAVLSASGQPDTQWIDPITGELVDGVRCATVDTAPPGIPRSPEDMQEWKMQNPPAVDGTIYVPVAYHVITATNGTTGNVTDDILQRQVDTLNTSFDGTGFQFYISSIDRTANDSWFYNTQPFDAQMKAALAIDPPHNLNLYTANIGGGILGYAYLPWSFPETSTLHGVVVLYSSLPGGSSPPYNLGATATHEVGHYLGLFHTFERGCSPPGDEVDDTPYEASPAFGCPTNRNTCNNEPEPDPVHNYMDYTDDICMWEFTLGQGDRMNWAVTTYKPSLLEAAVAPQAPTNPRAYSDHTIPTTIQLSWEDPTHITTGDTLLVDYFHVHIYRDGAFVDSVAGGLEYYEDVGRIDGQEYEYELYAKLDSSSIPGASVFITGTAGGSRVPGTPLDFGITGGADEVTLSWTNPSGNTDGSPMLDFAGIRLYQDDLLVATYTRAVTDTGNAESEAFTPGVPGIYTWHLTAIDNEVPMHESPPTAMLLTPLALPALDAFNVEGVPNDLLWTTTNADVNARSSNPPSPGFALNLNSTPIGRDTVEMRTLDLAGMQGSGVVFAYFYQPQGLGNAPEAEDSLRLYFRNDQDEWVLIAGYPGTGLQPFAQVIIDIEAAPSGSGSFFHSQFQAQFTSKGSAGAAPFDDWFVDNVFLGLPGPAISASMETIAFDTTMVGMTATATVYMANVGTQDLVVTDVVSSNQAVFSTPVTSFNLLAGENLAVEIEFSPDQAGLLTGTLTFTSNDPTRGSFVISLSGVGDVPVGIRENDQIPTEFALHQNYPNPFNPSTTIQFGIPVNGVATLEIFDLLGGKVRTLVTGHQEAGYYRVSWDGMSDAGQFVTSGVYLYRLSSQGFVSTRKMILIK